MSKDDLQCHSMLTPTIAIETGKPSNSCTYFVSIALRNAAIRLLRAVPRAALNALPNVAIEIMRHYTTMASLEPSLDCTSSF